MYINSIQSPQITSSKQPNFKASFVNDRNGYFQKIWIGASKTRDLLGKARRFHNLFEGDKLEIIGHKRHITPTGDCMGYDVFNHSTGEQAHYKAEPNMRFEKTLEFLLDSVLSDRKIFGTDTDRIYKYLTNK